MANATLDMNKLIALIRQRPALWDKNSVNHRNNEYVHKIWAHIAREMRMPKTLIQRKWKSLRDRFRIECKKVLSRQQEDGTDIEVEPAWQYYSQLIFLKDHLAKLAPYTPSSPRYDIRELKEGDTEEQFTLPNYSYERTSITAVNPDDEGYINESFVEVKNFAHSDAADNDADNNNVEEDDDDDDDDINMNILNSLTENEVQFEQFEVKTMAPRTSTNETANDKRLNAKILQIIEKNSAHVNAAAAVVERDEDIAFFDSLLPHMRTLQPSKKLLCRIEIQNIVYKHVYNAECDEQST